MISKGERAELRSLVKQQFRVLRADVLQRRAELAAEVERRIADRFRDEDNHREQITFLAGEIAREANRKLNDVCVEHGMKLRDGTDRSFFREPAMTFSDAHRHQMRVQMNADIDATVKAALARLDRQEVELLRTLAVGAIESDEARAFFDGIPTVGELVPAGRLLALTAGDDSE